MEDDDDDSAAEATRVILSERSFPLHRYLVTEPQVDHQSLQAVDVRIHLRHLSHHSSPLLRPFVEDSAEPAVMNMFL